MCFRHNSAVVARSLCLLPSVNRVQGKHLSDCLGGLLSEVCCANGTFTCGHEGKEVGHEMSVPPLVAEQVPL